MGCVYKARNTINGKCYVGQTKKSLSWRRAMHEAIANDGGGCYFQRALAKYGVENFEWIELHSDVPDSELNELEIACIVEYGTKAPHGYNLTHGGQKNGLNGYTHTAETRRKLRVAHLGKIVKPETREKLRLANLGKKQSAESKLKMSATRKGRPGKPLSEATKEKLRLINLGKKYSTEVRDRLSLMRRGHKVSEETRAKIAAWNKRTKTGKKRPPFSAETRERMSASAKRRAASPSGRNQLAAAVEAARHVPKSLSPENRAKQSEFMTHLWKCRKAESHLPVAS